MCIQLNIAEKKRYPKMKGGGSISMQCNNSLSSMEMIKSNHLNYNCSTDHHHHQNQSSTPSIFNLVNQLMPSSPSPPHVKSHCKKNPRETRRPIIQRKKQVRRRFHTTKPYQERLLNMAEARKEIVTALKFHRASMKKQQQPPPPPQPSVTIPALMHHIPSEQQQQTPLQAPVLPSSNMGVLGLNLSFRFQDYNFTNLDEAALPIGIPTTPHLNDELLISASSVNSSGALLQVDPTMAFEDECSSSSSSSSAQCEGVVAAAGPRALDDEEMAEMRSIGKKHQMEWDDTLNLATYACWFRFLQDLDLQEEEGDSLSCQFGDLL